MIITVLYDNPFYGLLIVNIINILYLISLIVINPLKECKNAFQNLFNEGCGIISMSIAFYMAYMDEKNIIDDDLKMKLGWGIIISNLMLISIFLLRLLIGWTLIFYHLFKELIKTMKQICNKSNKVYDENNLNHGSEKENIDRGIFDKIIEKEKVLR